MYRNTRISGIVMIMITLLLLLTGCGKSLSDLKVEITTLTDQEVFKIDGSVCTLPEAMLILTNIQNQYEATYDVQLWGEELENTGLEDYIKESAINLLARMKTMVLMAEENEITLTAEEEAEAEKAGKEYTASLSDKETEYIGIEEETVIRLYKEYALANKMFDHITENVDSEVSDDEARVMIIQHLFIQTYSMEYLVSKDEDTAAERVEFSEEDKQSALRKANNIHQRLMNGEDFQTLAVEYSDDETIEQTIRRGEMGEAFDEAAFVLNNEEISQVVETEDGFHIIRCVDNFLREATDANKEVIYNQRKTDTFDQVYDEFSEKLTSEYNAKLWESIDFHSDEDIKTNSFFSVYNQYFTIEVQE